MGVFGLFVHVVVWVKSLVTACLWPAVQPIGYTLERFHSS